ncbi:agmatine deiminase family protein [Maribellus maritimus]|uniref:agmatine deiminase family protein n=1 Tax=Maribellus maritimus TaxID=2870838 RepID=UPI001EEAFEBD|nr:agmatine deiminase family protein [Maribellus maritimus]MCG6189478.1 agmatine deiminase family protein [Maribellus maritimus]
MEKKNRKRLPAEWERQSFLQLTFPHKNSDWKYLLDEVSACFVDIIKTAAKFQDVLVVCDDVIRVKSYFDKSENVYFIQAESNDTWARDHSGITVFEGNETVIQDYIFNGWAQKFEAGLDNQITKKLFKKGIFENCSLQSFDFVLEGGSIESDGKGTILTTSECLLSKNRNEQFTQKEIENILKKNFGANRILWLNHGYLAGDDTDSHIDTLARFCNENTIAYAGCNNPDDEHFEALQKMKNELQQFTRPNGKSYDLIELPMPGACYDSEGNRLPATYANFTVINNAVLLPVYGVEEDEIAVERLKKCFPQREIIPLNCSVLIEQHGSLHCITMQYPEPVKLNKENFLK